MKEMSLAERISILPPDEQEAILEGLDVEKLEYDWSFWGRPSQIEPEVDYRIWLILAGRGFGKTRAGSEWLREKAKITKYGPMTLGIVARSSMDARTTMVSGPSGILATHPPSERPEYFPSRRELVYPNGNRALVFSSEEPNQLRGPSMYFCLMDEFAAYDTKPDDSGLTAFDNALFATREGDNPQLCLMTTPKRVSSVKQLLNDAQDPLNRIVITKGKTSDNAGNLSKEYIQDIYGKYQNTKLAKQELDGEMMDDIDGVLWDQENINANRVFGLPSGGIPPLRIVGVDPTVGSGESGDEAGIVVCGSTAERNLHERHAWVLEDATVQGPPEVWANAAVQTARKWRAPIAIEKNQGGSLLKGAIRNIDPNIPVYEVWAKQGKYLRAEPISLVYQQNRCHHVGYFPILEDQMVTWSIDDRKSPDRIDALVHALTALLITPPKGFMGGSLTATSYAGRRIPSAKPSRASGRRSAIFGAGVRRR